MIPRILEYDNDSGRVNITAQAYAIPELKAIIDKFPNPEPYLSYVHAMSAADSPYIRIPMSERQESVLYDVKETMGDFDHEDELVTEAIAKMRSLYESTIVLMAEQLEEEINEWRLLLKNERAIMGEGGNMKDRMNIMANIDKYAANVAKVRKQADDEIGPKMKGDNELGQY